MYLRIMKVLHNFPADDLNYFYMLTQGMGLGQIIRELMCVCFDLWTWKDNEGHLYFGASRRADIHSRISQCLNFSVGAERSESMCCSFVMLPDTWGNGFQARKMLSTLYWALVIKGALQWSCFAPRKKKGSEDWGFLPISSVVDVGHPSTLFAIEFGASQDTAVKVEKCQAAGLKVGVSAAVWKLSAKFCPIWRSDFNGADIPMTSMTEVASISALMI